MNLLQVAQWIQEGIREYNQIPEHHRMQMLLDKNYFVMSYVMSAGRGQLNPKIISELIKLETSVEDENGMTTC